MSSDSAGSGVAADSSFPQDREVQRLHIRSTIPGVDHAEATTWCLEHGRSGMGWRLSTPTKRASWSQYVSSAGEANSNVRRFHDLELGTLIWTREPTGEYWLGEITGEWQYKETRESKRLDLLCTRETSWTSVGTEEKVPGKVVNAFRSQRTLQRIGDPGARAYSNRLHALATNPDLVLEPAEPKVVLESLIGAEDLEDLVALYLQVTFGYVLVSRLRSTPGYEYVLKDPKGKTVVASVKSGNTPVDLSLLPAEKADLAYVFSVAGTEVGSTKADFRRIEFKDLVDFMTSDLKVLPDRVSAWFRTTGGPSS